MPDPRDESVYRLLCIIVRSIVDHPGDVIITTVQDDGGSAYTVTVNPQDIGLVIGRQGRTIKSNPDDLGRYGGQTSQTLRDQHR
jgi:uncharacterized protein